jgi:DNA-binding response OmpR family regulator
MSRSVLVVEDDHDLASLVALHLRDIGCEVTTRHDGTRGLEQALSGEHDLVILDLMLPGASGLDVCRALRGAAAYTPILMLTSKSTEFDRVTGLDAGADDYLTKPFSILELTARVKALFRRVEAFGQAEDPPARAFRVGDLHIDPERRQAECRGSALSLTAREFDLLHYFARHPGRVFNRSDLLDRVWGYGHDGYEHTVNSHINRLRAKLERDPRRPAYILTVWGVGYKLADPPVCERTERAAAVE